MQRLDRILSEAGVASRKELEELMSECPCPDCQGRRLRKESLAVTVGGRGGC